MPHSPARPPARPVASSHTSIAITPTEKVISSGALQAFSESANKPKATPGLVVCTRFSKPGTSTRSEPGSVYFSTACLLNWSAARAPIVSRLNAIKVGRDASFIRTARSPLKHRRHVRFQQVRRRSVLAHVDRIIPAALAFAALCSCDLNLQSSQRRAVECTFELDIRDCHLGDDEQPWQDLRIFSEHTCQFSAARERHTCFETG